MTAALLPVNVLEQRVWEDEEGEHREWEKSEGYHLFSPTQIDTFIECERKWAWKKIEKIYAPQNASAALGSKVHKILELYVGEGRKPDFVTDGEAAHVASSALHLLGGLRDARVKDASSVLLEGEFRFQSPRTNFVYHGIRDLSVRPGLAIPELEISGSAPGVGDYKTTKSINDYAKSKDDLLFDTQSTLYGYSAMAQWAMPVADLRWIYMQTKGARKSHVVPVRLTSAHAAKNFDAIERVAESMASALDKKLRPLDLAPNPHACRNFGGCPYEHLCTDLTSSQKAKAKMSGSLIASLRQRVQGASVTETPAGAGATATVITPPPVVEEPKPVMGVSDRDVPAPTEIPKAFTEPSNDTPINPPESKLPPPSVSASADIEKKEANADKPKRTRGRTPKPQPDPVGADAAAHTDVVASNGADKAEASGAITPEKKELEAAVDALTSKGTREDAREDAREGFTLYVDCLPMGRAPTTFGRFIEKAQTKILETQGVGDYRLVEYGKGAALFIGFVVQEIDGFQGELFLDTRTPEGAVLLETVSGMAKNVVRGLR